MSQKNPRLGTSIKLNTDQSPTYPIAIQLKKEGKLNENVVHPKVKYLNNIVESDHGKLKRLIKPTLGFKSMKMAYASLKGFETFRMFRKHQFDEWCQFPENLKEKLRGEIRLIERQFNLYSQLDF